MSFAGSYSFAGSDKASPAAIQLDNLAYGGLCAFVVALSSGGDGWIVGGAVFSTWVILIALAFLALRIGVAPTLRQPAPIHWVLLVFAIWSGLSAFWTVNSDDTFERIGTYISLLMFVLLIWELAFTLERVRGLMVAYVTGAALASLQTIYNYWTGQSTPQLEGLRYSVEGTNADELALIIALSIPMTLYLLVTGKSKALKIACWVQLVLGPIGMFLSGTRGAMIALVAGLVTLCGPLVARMSWTQRAIAVIGAPLLILGLLFYGPKAPLERFLAVGTELSEGTLTHRTVYWAAGLQVFRDHPFLGIGSGAYGTATARLTDTGLIAHNTFLSVLVELGVIGAIVFVLLLVLLISNASRLPYFERRSWFALLITWAVGASALTWEYRKATWLLFGLLAAQAYAARAVQFRVINEPRARDIPLRAAQQV